MFRAATGKGDSKNTGTCYNIGFITFKDQHTLSGIAGKGVRIKKHVGWVLVKHGLAGVREGSQGSRSACVEIQGSERVYNFRE